MKNSVRMLLCISAVLFKLQDMSYGYFDMQAGLTQNSRESVKRSYKAEASIFVPLLTKNQGCDFDGKIDNKFLLFIDVRSGVEKSGDKNIGKLASTGFGARYRAGDNNVFSAYTFYDYYLSLNGNKFGHVMFGAEIFSGKLEARVNSYSPVGKYEQSVEKSTSIKEIALKGLDGEIGYNNIADTGFGVYGGSYYFYRDNYETIKGLRVRAKFSKNLSDFAMLNLSGSFQKDKKRGDQFNVTANLKIPFGGIEKEIDHLMVKKIERMPGIMILHHDPGKDEIEILKDENRNLRGVVKEKEEAITQKNKDIQRKDVNIKKCNEEKGECNTAKNKLNSYLEAEKQKVEEEKRKVQEKDTTIQTKDDEIRTCNTAKTELEDKIKKKQKFTEYHVVNQDQEIADIVRNAGKDALIVVNGLNDRTVASTEQIIMKEGQALVGVSKQNNIVVEDGKIKLDDDAPIVADVKNLSPWFDWKEKYGMARITAGNIQGQNPLIELTGKNILRGFKIDDKNPRNGFVIKTKEENLNTGIFIDSNVIESQKRLFLFGVNDSIISNNIITTTSNKEDALHFYGGANMDLSNNKITRNTIKTEGKQANAIYFKVSEGKDVKNNEISNNRKIATSGEQAHGIIFYNGNIENNVISFNDVISNGQDSHNIKFDTKNTFKGNQIIKNYLCDAQGANIIFPDLSSSVLDHTTEVIGNYMYNGSGNSAGNVNLKEEEDLRRITSKNNYFRGKKESLAHANCGYTEHNGSFIALRANKEGNDIICEENASKECRFSWP